MSSDSEIRVNEQTRKRRVGLKRPFAYKSNIIKKARVMGSAYTNWKGRHVPAIPSGVNNPCHCRRQCYSLISETEREKIAQRFRNLETKNEQDRYLQSLIGILEVKRRRRTKLQEESSKPSRGCTFVYEISTSTTKIVICKMAFMNLHGISPDRVRRLCLLLSEGKSPIDNRGKSTPGNTIAGYVADAVREHISSFPVNVSRHSSKEVQCLNEKLDMTIMHKLFQKKNPDLEVKYSYYRKVFKEQFYLTFGRSRADTCCLCGELSVKIKSGFLKDEAKKSAVAEKIVHLYRLKTFSSTMEDISELVKMDDGVGAIVIHFMPNLQLPQIPVQEAHYLRQLTVSVFCIHDLKNGQATFFLYHEGNGTKGPNEVCSFLLQYADSKMSSIKNLHIFSDGCGDQIKSHTLVRMCSALVALDKFETVSQYFPIQGHSFLPCDSDFAVLKRKLKKADCIFTIEQYAFLIKSSAKNGRFEVITAEAKDIIDFKKWWTKHYKKTMLSIESIWSCSPKDEKVSFKISRFMHFLHSHKNKNLVVAKTFINGATQHTFRLNNNKKLPISLAKDLAYPIGKIPINKKKIEDIRKLLSYIPEDPNIQAFYDNIVYHWPICESEMGDNYYSEED